MKNPKPQFVHSTEIDDMKLSASIHATATGTRIHVRIRRKHFVQSTGNQTWRLTSSFSPDELKTVGELSGMVRAWIAEFMPDGCPPPDEING